MLALTRRAPVVPAKRGAAVRNVPASLSAARAAGVCGGRCDAGGVFFGRRGRSFVRRRRLRKDDRAIEAERGVRGEDAYGKEEGVASTNVQQKVEGTVSKKVQ